MKKLCALFLVLITLLSLLVGCASQPPAPDDTQDREAVTQLANTFFEAAFSLELKTAALYTDDAQALLANMPFESPDDFPAMVAESFPTYEFSYDEITAVSDELIGMIPDRFHYEVLSVEKDGETYLISAELTVPAPMEIDFNTFMQNEAVQELLRELMTSGKFSPLMDQQAALEVLIPAVLEKLPQST